MIKKINRKVYSDKDGYVIREQSTPQGIMFVVYRHKERLSFAYDLYTAKKQIGDYKAGN